MNNRRAFLIVLDGVGIGALPDADQYGDLEAHTLLHVAEECGPLRLPNLSRLGLGNILSIPGVEPVDAPAAAFGRMAERAAGKDTTAGHWEISGVIVENPLPTFPDGFPRSLLDRFEEKIGRSVIGNIAASGTQIIMDLGEEHVRTGSPIVYTSADSVFQIAAHEDVMPVEDLYRCCAIARKMLVGDLAVARVIARPFTGSRGDYQRSRKRHDYSLAPPGKTVFEAIAEEGGEVCGIGKISDIYAGRGITRSETSVDNDEGVTRLLREMERPGPAMVFVNLNDFDSLWGHRNDPESFARGLEAFDLRVPEIMARLSGEDLLLITADHGNDPTTPGTDHSREYVPVLLIAPGASPGLALGTRSTFADVAATLAGHLGVSYDCPGRPMQQD